MNYHIVRLIGNVFLSILHINALFRLLELRNKVVFATVSMVGMFASLIGELVGAHFFVRLLLAGPLISFVFPIAYSQGPLVVRATRVILLNMTVLFSEFVTNLIIATASGPNVSGSIYDIDVRILASAYLIMLPIIAFMFQLLIAFFNRTEKNSDAAIHPPVIALLVWSHFVTVVSAGRYITSDYTNAALLFITLAFTLLSLVIGLATLRLVQRSAEAQRQAARVQAVSRQTELLRAEIEESVQRSTLVRRLRHDLANQMNVVCELAEKGHTDEALDYITSLEKRAHEVVAASEAARDEL